MRLVLNRIREMELEEGSEIEIQEGFVPLKVLFCGVCRTDAKMWDQGQRDLLLPRVLGHEVVAQDQEGNHYLIWPGKNCGRCRFCKQGMENLCEELKIMGFDYDGGFQTTVAAPKESLVPIPSGIPLELASLAEPVACLLHGLEKLSPRPGGSVIIFGGGTVGLLCALLCQDMGLTTLVIEKSQEKIEKAGGFLALTRIPCKKETMESEFGAAINACDDPGAFAHCLLKLEKAGTFSFFSGLTKNKHLE
ncbi:MAG TPA: FAD-binding protein, partial [Desulfobacterales bacterium]|nr:FAD-binding protein [Desulfobacterales bacterium]